MNVLKGEIITVKVSKNLSLVSIKVGQSFLSAIVIDTQKKASYLKIGNSIDVIFKETEVIVGKGTSHEISLQNKLEGKVHSIETSELLSKLVLETQAGRITSIITTNAVDQLQLKKGSEITAMIKTNEIMLSR